MAQKHTPGPWKFGKDGAIEHNNVQIYIDGADGTLIVYGQVKDADARLIAAAPELLDALKDLLETFESEIHCEYDGTSMLYEKLSYADGARAAIAKATNQPKE